VFRKSSVRWKVLGATALTAGLTLSLLGLAASPAAAAPTHDPVLGAGKVQADINGDGYADLITSTLLYDDDRSGALVVLFGSATGLRTNGQQRLNPSDLPAPGVDAFLIDDIVTGDFDGDGFDDLAIANPRAMLGSDESAGAVYIVPGSAAGLDLAGAKTWTQSSPGVAGSPSRLDEFGSALAAADFGGGPEIDLAIGVRGHRADQNFTYGSGIVQVLYGSPTGLTGAGSQVWSQDTRGVPGKAENADFFGEDLAAGNFDGKNKADLAVGVPWENHSGAGNAGAVTVIYSSASKLSAAGSEIWTQSTRGVAGKAEHGDFFGNTLAAGNFTGSSRDDLAISAINEEFSGRDDRGSVTVLKGSSTGLTAKGSQVWSQKQLGAGNETADRLGETLVAADFGRNSDGTVRGDLVIGSRPGYGEPTPRAYLLYGSNAGLGQVQIIEHGSGAFAAADFNTKVGAEGRYADLARVNQNETVDDSFSLEIFAGSATGLPTAKSQSIPLSAVNLPDPPDVERLLQLNAAGSR
jgi:hypothetical protein